MSSTTSTSRIFESVANDVANDGAVDAATAVNLLSERVRKASSVDDFLWDTWNNLVDVAGSTPHARQDRLVDFMVRLRQETVAGPDGEVLAAKGGAGEVWKDLPTLGWVARDVWNFDVQDSSASHQQIVKFDNQTAFLARLTALADLKKPNDPFDYSLYGLWALRTAFEDPQPSSSKRHMFAVKNAALWIRYSSDALQKLVARNHDLPENYGVAGDLCSDKGWKGFNQDRWALWKAGFEKARGQVEKADSETKELVETAVQRM